MCPSYRVTRDERDVTRGRANTLRLAVSGQLGPDALTSDEMMETLKLCVSCKACRRECPTGVDMARMKIEVQAARVKKRGLSLHDRLVGYLPRYAPFAARHAGACQSARRQPAPAPRLGNLRRLFGPAQPAEMAHGHLPRPLRLALSRDATDAPTSRGATWCCSPTLSTAISSAKISTPRCACSPPAAIACMRRCRRTATRVRSAAAAPSSRPG